MLRNVRDVSSFVGMMIYLVSLTTLMRIRREGLVVAGEQIRHVAIHFALHWAAARPRKLLSS